MALTKIVRHELASGPSIQISFATSQYPDSKDSWCALARGLKLGKLEIDFEPTVPTRTF